MISTSSSCSKRAARTRARRFGKLGVICSKKKIVDNEIYGVPVELHMEAFFVECVADTSDEDIDTEDDDDEDVRLTNGGGDGNEQLNHKNNINKKKHKPRVRYGRRLVIVHVRR